MINGIQKVAGLSMTRDLGEVTSSSSAASAFGAAGSAASTGASFSEVLGNMAVDAANSLKSAEAISFDGITGKANTREVVDAVLQAQQSLQTAIAFRDKIVSAYLDITKMQI
ncbi:flagellar hook-basal body complex protein FliE [Rhizobium lemnae]|uniref:Flagellar hook-basal body complex protein FliE n=1 Tax=Rhizobium lemnae TaxID=1214924 RepID=A0ABV8E9D4_9HYPH|nr:flagellar hook-basal body complex protein FliE [Rhizobium lemnae]MCJ8506404.1 flagellar hook-basal body complex protein FliE [Rhizobium lemnae]